MRQVEESVAVQEVLSMGLALAEEMKAFLTLRGSNKAPLP